MSELKKIIMLSFAKILFLF